MKNLSDFIKIIKNVSNIKSRTKFFSKIVKKNVKIIISEKIYKSKLNY